MPNLAKLTDLDALECELRKALELENYGTPFEVVLPVSVSGMHTDAL